MTDQDKEIKERLHAIFPSPEVAAQVTNIVVSKRPNGWSRKSCAPYYKEIYAKQLKESIDSMIQSGNRLVYSYARWCNVDTGMSHNTLYQRINQSIRYLIERMDDADQRYHKWWENVKCYHDKQIGAVVIEYVPGLDPKSEGFKAEEAIPRDQIPRWRRELEVWLESDNVAPYIKEELMLTPEEVKSLQESLNSLVNVMANVTATTIKIVKMKV